MFSTYINNYISTLNLQENKTYYMFFDIDYDKDVDESDETNYDNIKYIEFKYSKSTTGKSAYLNTKGGLITIPLEDEIISTDDLEINEASKIQLTDNKTKSIESNSLSESIKDYTGPIISPSYKYNIKVYKLLGTSLVVNKTINAGTIIDISYLAEGIYVVHVNNKYVKKIIIDGMIGPITPIPVLKK